MRSVQHIIEEEASFKTRTSGILMRIMQYYPSLNEAEQKVANLILSDPEAVKGLSVMRIAELSGVSQTTVVRFCRSIGFEGYSDFKMSLVEELVSRAQLVPHPHSDVGREDSLTVLVQKVLSMDMQALANTLNSLDMEQFALAVKALTSANATEILGVGSSLPVAMDVYYRFLRSGINSRFSVDSHMQAINAALLGPRDVAVAISYSGEAKDTIDSVELAKQAGATTICITNFPRSSLATRCDIRLVPSVQRTRWLDEAITGRLGQLAIVDALCVAISREKEQEVVPRLERIQKAINLKRRK